MRCVSYVPLSAASRDSDAGDGRSAPSLLTPALQPPYSDEKVANRDTRVWLIYVITRWWIPDDVQIKTLFGKSTPKSAHDYDPPPASP